MNLGLGPGERAGVVVVAGDEGVDVGLELIDALEGRTAQRFAAEDREPDLDLVQPGRMGRRVMEMHVGMACPPEITLGFVRREVVEDDVDLAVWIVGHHCVHEVEEFDAPTPLVVTAGHLAGGDIQGGEQRCRPVPPVIVRLADHRAARGQLEIALGVNEKIFRLKISINNVFIVHVTNGQQDLTNIEH